MSPFSAELAERYRAEGFWGDLSVPRMFERSVARVPDRVALVDPPNRPSLIGGAPRRYTYSQMDAEVNRFAAALRARGLGRGALIATQLPNMSEMILIYLAALRIGAVLSPVTMAYRAAELAALSDVARFDAYISVGAVNGKPYYPERIDALGEETRLLGIGGDLPPRIDRIDPQPGDSAVTPGSAAPGADDLFAVFWTSGTEGQPKAVPKTHNNLMATSLGAWKILELPDGANVLAPFPFVNAAAMSLMMCWMRTAGALILHHPFDVDTFLDQLNAENIDYTMVAPTLLTYLRERSEDPALKTALHGLRGIGTGSAPPDPEVFGFFRDRFGIEVLNFFGSNEGVQLCSSGESVEDPRKRATLFPRDGDVNWQGREHLRTANGGTFKLVEPETGRIVTRPGDIGEMFIAGPAVMPGYYRHGAFDRSHFDADGYFASRDLFQIADCGTLLRFHARSRELIIRGGMKIAPVELDNFVSALPGVREAAAAPYPDRQMGEKVCLFVVPEDGARITLADITACCDRGGLAKFKWPEKLILCDALPRTPLAKLDRKALARRVAAEMADGMTAAKEKTEHA